MTRQGSGITRLVSTLHWDARLQFRNGFYYASAFVAVVFIVLLSQFSIHQKTLALLLPAILMQNILMNTFYFMAGIVLLEKGEGILEGLVVSPLRKGEYLLSKVITLTLLSLVEVMVVAIALYGFGFNLSLMAAGVVLLGIFFALLGFVAVARYESINTFLLPSVLMVTLLSIPLLDYFGLWQSWLVYLHPVQAPLLLMKAAFQPVAGWQLVYGVVYSVVWVGVTYAWSRRAFYRFVILKQGVR
jgi:fluoroquinolone transport system permease protein